MIRLLKLVLVLALLGLAGLTAFAYLGDFAPDPVPVSGEITIEID
jgi:predicted small integral membrane protein